MGVSVKNDGIEATRISINLDRRMLRANSRRKRGQHQRVADRSAFGSKADVWEAVEGARPCRKEIDRRELRELDSRGKKRKPSHQLLDLPHSVLRALANRLKISSSTSALRLVR